MRFLEKLLEQDEAATAVEYAVMLAMIILVALAAISFFGSKTSGLWDTIRTAVLGM